VSAGSGSGSGSGSSTAPSLGVVFLPSLAPERLQSIAQEADRVGLPELWLWEDCFKEGGLTTAAAALAWTTQLRVGIGLLPVPLRNVAVTAMEVATLQRLFPGRLLTGIGHGVQEWMEQVGVRAASPMTLLREYAEALRALLAGQTVTTAGGYVRLSDVGLSWPAAEPSPLLIGAVGPRTLAMSGELADGTIMTGGTTPDEVRAARQIVDAAAAAAGRNGHRIVVFMIAATGPDAEARLAADLVDWDVTGELELAGVAGDAEAVAAGVRRLCAAGADSVVLQPTRDVDDVEAFVGFVAQEVGAVLSGEQRPT
jgi:alkanesulfonate monooxygenase SsuD/methylene tetrahydromethanopterin reductase-like flavin-dependent oxidoreductase (luciferase family)